MKTSFSGDQAKEFNKFLDLPFSMLLESPKGELGFEWCGRDDKKTFENNLESIDGPALEYYLNNPFYYKVNKHRYRAPEFEDIILNEDGTIDVALGCSFTFGIGVPEEWTWPSLYKKLTGRNILNLGRPGGGSAHSYVALNQIIERFKIKNVLHFHPTLPRALYLEKADYTNEIFLSTLLFNSAYENSEAKLIFKEDYFKQVMCDTKYLTFIYKRDIDAILGLCKSYNISYYNFSFYSPKPTLYYPDYIKNRLGKDISIEEYICKVIKSPGNKEDDIPARDLLHPSKNTQKLIANRFINKIRMQRFRIQRSRGYIEPFSDHVL